ncbi:MAG: hypothetical protein HY080_03835 [Gammaproteobacteria bacterium]|nr:hypothetical protein [Gammaproteobacteria bacterium]
MDQACKSVATFLECLQECMTQLHAIHDHFVQAGIRGARPFLNLSGRPFTILNGSTATVFSGSLCMGFLVETTKAREYDLHVNLLWDNEQWLVETQAWVDNDAGGQDMLRALPVRSATQLVSCIEQIKLAVADLATLREVVKSV